MKERLWEDGRRERTAGEGMRWDSAVSAECEKKTSKLLASHNIGRFRTATQAFTQSQQNIF